MGLALVIAGILLWVLLGWVVVGVVLIVVGLILLFAPGPFYGYGYWHGRRNPPP